MTPLGIQTHRRNVASTFVYMNMVANCSSSSQSCWTKKFCPFAQAVIDSFLAGRSGHRCPVIPLLLASILGAWVIYPH